MQAGILFAEVGRALQEVIAEQLQEEAYAVTTAVDGLDATECLENARYDLALLDIGMPRKDGLEVLQEIRTRRPRMRVIMLTGVDEFSVALEAMKRGADDCITKPITLSDLLGCIRRALER